MGGRNARFATGSAVQQGQRQKDDKPYQCSPQVGGMPVLTLLGMDIISRHARSILAWQLSTVTGEHSPSSEPLIQSVFSHRG
jgi:hypothetical protein